VRDHGQDFSASFLKRLLELLGKPLAVRIVYIQDGGCLVVRRREFSCNDALEGVRGARPEEEIFPLVSREHADQW